MNFPNNITGMEPLIPRSDIQGLKERANDLVKKASALGAQLNPQTAKSVRQLLRSMNSYYSNLIEGQSTHPYYIDQALKQQYEKDPQKKNLQMLAIAHIQTQEKAADFLIANPTASITSPEFLKWLHNEFYSKLPKVFLEIEFNGEVIYLTPGEFRGREVTVGSHFPPLVKELAGFMQRFDQIYSSKDLDPLVRIIAGCAAHLSLAWIHPFLDGNGRVMRLFSDCFFMREGIGGFGLWTISRGLARKKGEYYKVLAAADDARRGDLDGRGALSDQTLSEFCSFFLGTAIDQVEFMSTILNLENFEKRLTRYMELLVDFFGVRKEAFFLLRDLYLRGHIARGEASRIMNLHERISSTVISDLVKYDIVRSETPKSELYLNFNPLFAYYMFPNLYPESLDFTQFLPGKR